VSVATGRLYSGTRTVCEALGLKGPVGCADGSQLVDAADHRALVLHTLEPKTVEWLLGVDATPFLFAEDRVHYDARGERHLGYASTWSRQTQAHADVAQVPSHLVNVVLLLGAPEVLRATHERAHAEGHTTLTFAINGEQGLVVRVGGIDKGTAVEFIAA